MPNDVRVQVRFEQDGHSDALYYPMDVWPVSASQLADAKAQRVAHWKQAIEDARNRPAVEPTREQLVADIETLEATVEFMRTHLRERDAGLPPRR